MSDDDRDSGRNQGVRLTSAVVLLAFVVGLGVAFGASGATAGDNVAVIEFEPEELSVAPGDTVDVDLTLRSHGEFADVGVSTIELQVEYPADYLTVTEIDPGDWFDEAPDNDPLGEGQAHTEVREQVTHADENGAALLEQSLVAPEFGVIGTAPVATVTVEVSEDAEPATAQLAAERTRVFPTRSRYSQPTSVTPAAFHIDGGGDVVEPAFVDDPFADVDGSEPDDGETAGDGKTAGDGGSADGDTGAADGETTTDSGAADGGGETVDDEVPAPVGAVVLGILLAAFGARRRVQH